MKNQKTKFVILGLLTIEPMSGYEMKSMIAKSTGHFWSESNGQLYPALKSLEKEKLISVKKELNGKKASFVYSITQEGQKALEQWLESDFECKSIERDEELLKLFFGKNVTPVIAISWLKKRQQRIKEKLTQFLSTEKEIEEYAKSPHYLYWVLSLKNGIAHTKAELGWCQECIRALTKGRVS